jgi:hypothetical protein
LTALRAPGSALASIGKCRALQIVAAVAELCMPSAVANRSPRAAGSSVSHSQQPKMIKSISALAISALLAASLHEARLAHR